MFPNLPGRDRPGDMCAVIVALQQTQRPGLWSSGWALLQMVIVLIDFWCDVLHIEVLETPAMLLPQMPGS